MNEDLIEAFNYTDWNLNILQWLQSPLRNESFNYTDWNLN